MVIYSYFLLFSRWRRCWQQGSTFAHRRIGILCLRSSIVMVSMLATSRGLFIGTLRLLRGNSYLWCVCVVIYERPMTDRIRCVHQVIVASTSRWTFEGGMREAAREALAVLWHEADERMAHSQYLHFPSRAEAMVLPAGDRDRIGCFTDQVKLTHALFWDLDEAVKEDKLFEEHEEESS
jgi:hypothetical protein